MRRRASAGAGTIALFILGILVDAAAVINVPGTALAAAEPDAAPELTGLGTVIFLVAVVAWVSVFARRSLPLLVLISGAVLALIGVSYLLLLIGAVSCIRRHPAWTKGIGIGVAALVVLFALREATTSWGGALAQLFAERIDAQYEPVWIAASFIWAVVSLAAAVGIVFLTRARDSAELSSARAAEQQQRADALSEQMVRQSERERIARDMHDQLTSRLSVVSLHAGALEAVSGQGDDRDEAVQMARTVREQTHAALQDLRGLLGDLRTGPGERMSSPATMRALGVLLADRRAAGASIDAYVMVEAPERASTQFDSAVYRIVQESLTNALKHAPRERVEVHVQVDPVDGARVRIVNPLGSAASAVPGGGNGILGIRERAAALGGTAWIGAHEGTFIVDVTLPWQERG